MVGSSESLFRKFNKVNNQSAYGYFSLKISHKLVSSSFFLEAIDSIERKISEVKTISLESDFNVAEHIKSQILTNNFPGSKVVVFAGGGVDSNALLIMLSELEITCLVFSYVNANNKSEVDTLIELCGCLGFEHRALRSDSINLDIPLRRFVERFGRYPRDVAAPIVTALLEASIDEGDHLVAFDGQYADTMMCANPQNRLYLLGNNLPQVIPNTIALWLLDKIQNKRIRKAMGLISSREVMYLTLCDIAVEQKSISAVKAIIDRHPNCNLLVFQCIFLGCLLKYRESDKYLLYPSKIISPFHSLKILKDSITYPRRYNSLLNNKIPLRKYVRKRFPGLTLSVKSQSFKP